jgi:thiol:disulfide interchange protein
MKLNHFATAILIVSSMLFACKARKVNTETVKQRTETQTTIQQQSNQQHTDSTSTRQQSQEHTQTDTYEEYTIYPERGKQFTIGNGTYTGTADSIKHRGRTKTDKTAEQRLDYGTKSSTAKTQSAVISQQQQTSTRQKQKQTDSKALIPGWVWVLSAVIAGACLCLYISYKR